MATQSDKPVVLYTQGTPNGWPISVFLEELKEKYGSPDYESVAMSIRDADIGKVHNQVKSPWFLEVRPHSHPIFHLATVQRHLQPPSPPGASRR